MSWMCGNNTPLAIDVMASHTFRIEILNLRQMDVFGLGGRRNVAHSTIRECRVCPPGAASEVVVCRRISLIGEDYAERKGLLPKLSRPPGSTTMAKPSPHSKSTSVRRESTVAVKRSAGHGFEQDGAAVIHPRSTFGAWLRMRGSLFDATTQQPPSTRAELGHLCPTTHPSWCQM